MKFFYNMIMSSIIMMILSLMLMYNNMFISMEIPMINMMSIYIPISLILDWISCMFMSTVMFISSMIIFFSMFYIPIKEHKQFMLMLLMFVSSMLILIMSDNIIFILVGWDGLGLSSYILVVYYQNFISSASGTITLLSNRLGDIMILISISMLMMNSNWNLISNKEYNTLSMILLIIAASSKSAQFPFSAWLPAAMAAPTPISALVHSSTLVTAGVFLLIRIMNNIHPMSLSILMISSSMTTMFSSMAANWEQDMKKIIALSTLSQIAMMMFAISMKSPTLAFFHLITHALFKSTMFLCAGIMIHNSSYQDMRMMGMNFINSILPFTILSTSSMALMGLPFLSGFFSKDSIIQNLMNLNLNSMLSYMMIMSIGMTAIYTIRMSIFSNNNLLMSKPDTMMHETTYSNNSTLMMAPMSIMMGTCLLWNFKPEQLFILPNMLKISIPLTILMGLIIGISLSFKSLNFIKTGNSSISLWFIHFLTIIITKTSSPLMHTLLKNDNSWQESYGPKGNFLFNINLTTLTNKFKNLFPLLLMMLLMFPMLMN